MATMILQKLKEEFGIEPDPQGILWLVISHDRSRGFCVDDPALLLGGGNNREEADCSIFALTHQQIECSGAPCSLKELEEYITEGSLKFKETM